MKSIYKLHIVLFLASLSGLIIPSACIDEGVNAIEGKGNNFFKMILHAETDGTQVLGLDPIEGTYPVLEVRRFTVNESTLKTSATVQYQIANSIVDSFNAKTPGTANDFNIPDAETVSIVGNSFEFQSGEFSKTIELKLNPEKIDFSKKYGIGLILSTPGSGYQIGTNADSILIQIVVKNRFDGIYVVTGNMVDASNATLSGYFPWEIKLITSGSTTVTLYDNEGLYSAGPSHIIKSGADFSRYGSFAPVFILDQNNNVTSVVNSYGQPASNGRSAELDPSGVNKWDPATKTLKVKYWMNQPSVITPHRTSFDETFTYKKPR